MQSQNADSAAWALLDDFLTKNAAQLKLVAHWGDGDLGAVFDLIRLRLDMPKAVAPRLPSMHKDYRATSAEVSP